MELGDGGWDGALRHPTAQVLEVVADLLQDDAGLAHIGLGRVLVEVGIQGVGDQALIVGQGLAQRTEGLLPEGPGTGGAGEEIGVLPGYQLCDFHEVPPYIDDNKYIRGA